MNGPLEPALRLALQQPEVAEVAIADPRGLDFQHRFDVLAKWLYARTRLGQRPAWAHLDPVALYNKHIHLRTGGREPGDEQRKGDLAAFQREFDALIDGMAMHGFDTRHPVPFSRTNQLPYNGAHRLAAALALGCDVAWTWHDGPGRSWDAAWFVQHGFTDEEVNLLLRAWREIEPARVAMAVLWSPVEAGWPTLQQGLADAGWATMAARTVALPRVAFDQLVRDVYAFDWGPQVGPPIEQKVQRLAAHPARARVLFLRQPEAANAGALRDLKTALRESVAALAPVDWFASLHVSESAAEAAHLFEIFANANNLRRLVQRGALRPGLVAMLAEAHAVLKERGIAAGDCCVVGGASLDTLGLRAADDVDLTLLPALRAQHFDRGIHRIGPRTDIVTQDYARSFHGPAPDDGRLLADPSLHYSVRGFKVADPQVVLARRQHQRRDKDLRDLPLLAAFLDRA